jgi:hypothetical protein
MKHKINPENFRDGIKLWIQECIFYKKKMFWFCVGLFSNFARY